MRYTLNYGKSTLPVSLPDAWDITVVSKKTMPVLSLPEQAVCDAFATAVESPPLLEIARGKKKVCIVICDITRPVPNKLILEPLLACLDNAGVPRESISILVATGLHRPNEGEELVSLVGSRDIVERYTVLNHYAARDDEHVFFPPTAAGTPVGIDRRFIEADLRIVVGLVEPHFMAGFSGGRKVIAPGICHESTIRTFHNARIMGDPAAANLNLEHNPLHREQMTIAASLHPVYAVNTVLDEERRLSFVNFGEVAASHEQAVAYARPFFRVPLTRRFKTIVTSAAGAPLDLNFYQTVKGLVGAKEVLAPGGRIFIASECSEGLGSPEFRASQQQLAAQGWKGFLQDIATRDKARVDEWETQKLTEILALGSAVLYSSGLPEADRALTCIGHTDCLERSVADWVESVGDTGVLVVPEGPYVIPTLA